MKTMCISCPNCPWEDEVAIAEYTTRVYNVAPLCETCLSLWLRNAASDLELAPIRLKFL